jgi:hypothetical protein
MKRKKADLESCVIYLIITVGFADLIIHDTQGPLESRYYMRMGSMQGQRSLIQRPVRTVVWPLPTNPRSDLRKIRPLKGESTFVSVQAMTSYGGGGVSRGIATSILHLGTSWK